MTKSGTIIEKVEVSNQNNSKPPQFNGKAGDTWLLWSMKFKADMVMKGLSEAFLPEFESKLPEKEAGPFDDEDEQKKAIKMNQKAMMQLTLAFSNVSLLNKINCEQRRNKANWPTGKAHKVMSVLFQEYEPEDMMAEMEMELALQKLKLGPKKDPNSLNDEMASIECRYSIEMTNGKKKAQVMRLGGVTYASVIATTQMIWREKGKELQVTNLLNEMHMQWRLAGGKSKDEKALDDDEELIVPTVATAKNWGEKKKYENPNKDKICNHCKKKGHVEASCWEKHPDKIPEKVKAARNKAKAQKGATTASVIEEEILLGVVESQM